MKLRKPKKIYGPYTRKDNRKHVILIYEDGSSRTVSYPKWLVENKLNRELDPNTETIDHIDRNFENNLFSNLQIKNRKSHSKEDVKRIKRIKQKCVLCGKLFKQNPKSTIASKRKNKSGPFCSKKCSGFYGSELQNGRMSKIKNNSKIKIEYFRKNKKNINPLE